jgi:hypothetical protein
MIEPDRWLRTKTTEEITDMIKSSSYCVRPEWFPKYIKKDVNNDKKYLPIYKGGKLPLYGETFDKMNMDAGRILGQIDYADFWEDEATQNGFWDYYMGLTDLKIDLKTAVKAWRARAVRNYCSLLREYHLYSLLIDLEDEYLVMVNYKRYYDAQGYDFVLDTPAGTLGIRSYADTEYSLYQLDRKEEESNSTLHIPYEDLPINPFDEAKWTNGFALYSVSDLSKVINTLAKIA